jgi:hypothetical protein
MTKAKARVYDAAENVRPYVERAMRDEALRLELMRAFATAREIYSDLVGDKNKPVRIASRVATDDEIRDKLREAIEDLRRASDRLQGRKDRAGRNTTLLIAGITLGILFNPITGPETRRFIKDLVTGGDSSLGGGGSTSSNGRS